jgi:hypothetical protein
MTKTSGNSGNKRWQPARTAFAAGTELNKPREQNGNTGNTGNTAPPVLAAPMMNLYLRPTIHGQSISRTLPKRVSAAGEACPA